MATATVVNGLNVQGIQDLVEMVKAQPQVAKAAFYATNIWRGGFHNEAVVKPFSMGGVRKRHVPQKGLHNRRRPSPGAPGNR